MSVKMKFGSKDIPFVYKGNKLVYPNPIKDGLLLWYDFKGMRNTDTNKEVAKDLSLNGNDGTLTNFNFTEESGYKDNTLVFDGVDDKLTTPELELDPEYMTVLQDGNIYSYEDDKVLTIGGEGEIISSGKNLLFDSTKYHKDVNTTHFQKMKHEGKIWLLYGYAWGFLFNVDLKKDETYTLSIMVYNPDETESSMSRLYVGHKGNFQKLIPPQEKMFLSYTFKAAEDEDNAVIRILVNGHNFPVLAWGYPMFKKGEEKTPYSPAPEDFLTAEYNLPSMKNLQIYNKPLLKGELLHNAESKGLKQLKPGVVVQDGLMLHYDFSHESNASEYKDKAFDYSGNGNHGVLTNFAYSDYSGYQNGGLEFDGVDDEVVIPYKNNIFSVDFTWSAVIKPYIVDKDMMFMCGSTTAQYFRIENGKLGASVRGQDSPVAYALTNFALDANTAYHVVLSHTNGNFKVYANGEQVGESDKGRKNERYRLSWIGKYTSSDPRAFEGAILSAQVHNKALSAEEIAHNYQIEKEKFNIVEGEM